MITKDAKSKKGLFTVHQVGERFFLRNPQERTGQAISCGTRRSPRPPWARVTAAASSPTKWSSGRLRNNRVYLREINFSVTRDPDSPIATAVKDANNDTIIMAFNVAAYHDGAR